MAQGQKGLGRGLEALLGGFHDDEGAKQDHGILTVSLDAIRPNPEQPRRTFSEQALQDLADSIREQGLLQPLLVRPTSSGRAEYEIVAGERRWRAARLAGLDSVPILVRDLDDAQSLALALIENLQREDLNPVEQAAGLHLLQTRFGMSQDSLARTVGMSRPAVSNALRLLQLDEPIRDDLAAGTITPGHARALLAVGDESLRQALWRRIVDAGLSVREAEDAANWIKDHGALPEETVRPAPAATNRRRRPPRSAPDPGLRHLGAHLTQACGLVVKTGGSLEHGKITFHYRSQQELAGLLAQFGLSVVEDTPEDAS